jgi:thiosulfate/3-mercaptopyruvate sulfurtransferase
VRKVFESAGVDLSSPVVTTCGSGVTAAVLLFALASIGKHDVTLYDGSWTEWGSRADAPAATGPA